MLNAQSEKILTSSAVALAEMIRQGEIQIPEIVRTHIEFAKWVNPDLNAIVKDRYTQALFEADEMAKNLASQKSTKSKMPLYGVPCTIKEAFAVKGFPNSGGLYARRHHISTENAEAVQRVVDAGANILGITNISELCMWMESNNRVYGRSNNPYNLKHIVGGSSGGEGAIIGAGASPFGIGSDIGGSIRMPAFFNGVFGHKPSAGLVPATGQWPISSGKGLRYLTSGVLCRRAEDLYPLYQIISGPDGQDVGCEDIQLKDPKKVSWKNVTVYNIANNGVNKIADDLAYAQKQAAASFVKAGAVVRDIQIDGLKKSFDLWSAKLATSGSPSFKSMLSYNKKFNGLKELGLWFTGAGEHTIPAILLAILEDAGKLMPSRMEKLERQADDLKSYFDELLAGDVIILFPSYTSVAPRHMKPMMPPFNWVYTAIINVMELPATQIPLGLNKEGLPLGLQVVAGHGNDHLGFAAAQFLEQQFGGWAAPWRVPQSSIYKLLEKGEHANARYLTR